MVTARVTYGGMSGGSVGPFPVDNPWWAEVEPVVAHLEATLGVPVVVLRLLTVEGADGARDGHVTYHVEALRPPRNLTGCVVQDEDHSLRMPWARASGITELLRWASRYVDVVGPPAQRKTWNLAGLFRLPTVDGPVWLKALPPFAAAEPIAIAAVADADPTLVPTVLASAPGRMLLADIPGRDGWDAPRETVADAVRRLSVAQARIDRPATWPSGPAPGGSGSRRQRPARRLIGRRTQPRRTACRETAAGAVGDAGGLRPAGHGRAR